MTRPETPPTDSRILTGVFLVIVGGVLLALNVGWLHIDIWALISHFWPLALIMVGLRFVITSPWIYGAIGIVLVAGAIWATSYAPDNIRHQISHQTPTSPQDKQTLDEDLGAKPKLLKVSLDFGAAEVMINGLTNSIHAYEATFENAATIRENIKRSNDELKITLEEASSGKKFWENVGDRRASLSLTPDVPLDVRLESGASKQTLDFSSLLLERLTLDMGASSGTLTFGAKADNLVADIDSGASSLTLRVPKTVGLRIVSDNGLASDNFEIEGLDRSGDTFQTSDFDTAEHKITIRLDTGASSTKLERY